MRLADHEDSTDAVGNNSDAVSHRNGSIGGSLQTTIALSPTTRVATSPGSPELIVYGDASFTVTRSIPYDKETIWVTQHCFDAAANRLSKLDHAVLWGTSLSLEGTTSPFPTSGTRCTAFVTLRPWQDRTLGDASPTFLVGQ